MIRSLPKQPDKGDVRAAELALLPGLLEELRQPSVRPWTRWQAALLALDCASFTHERSVEERRRTESA